MREASQHPSVDHKLLVLQVFTQILGSFHFNSDRNLKVLLAKKLVSQHHLECQILLVLGAISLSKAILPNQYLLHLKKLLEVSQ